MLFKDLLQCQTGVENFAISLKKTQQLDIFHKIVLYVVHVK